MKEAEITRNLSEFYEGGAQSEDATNDTIFEIGQEPPTQATITEGLANYLLGMPEGVRDVVWRAIQEDVARHL